MFNILVVDDEYLSRKGVKSIIQEELEEDIKVLEASNGIEARKIVDEQNLDVILLDINIPGINGIDLCRYIKSKYADIHIIVTTAYDDLATKNKIMNLNISKYLEKPIRPQKIVDSLKKILNINNKNLNSNYSEIYINKLKIYILNNSYKESVEMLKEYVDFLYKSNDEKVLVDDINNFINKLEEICKNQNIYIDPKINYKIVEMKKGNYNYLQKNELLSEFVNLVNNIFDSILIKDNTSNNYVKDIKNYIKRNINKNITLEDAASYVNLSPHYLSKIFKKETGVNFISYLTDRRIEVAKDMLEDENMPISNIAIELCYSKSNYFSKVFKKKVGLTPSEYREQYLKKKLCSLIK
ncbi:response regulator [Romboutsia ilealis]|uniref:Stage 0 sporulation protein A homolog n=1 Tax=Romboutsia faecis TaxID=2764597 RepID=A0ABR7JT14_9FIRM|nr:response regulator [Romboutsia faecis]MBC5997912.1 response regulator [Romboutsia faecis]MRN25607.1 response regulator [Romboutsia ilealis]